MGMLVNVILTVQILTALGMIGLILIQHGKGADMGAAFGSGASWRVYTSGVGGSFVGDLLRQHLGLGLLWQCPSRQHRQCARKPGGPCRARGACA